jgi:hypothetical protein
MIQLKKLTDEQLDNRVKTLAEKEREMIFEIILTVKEVYRRRLYLTLGKPSLFAYLSEEGKFTQGSAQRYIDAARLVTVAPELEPKLESGELTLSHVTLIQKASRQKESDTGERVSAEIKLALGEKIAKTTVKEAKLIIAKELNMKIKEDTKLEPQADETYRLEVTLTKAQQEKLERTQELLSHIVPSGDIAKLLEYLTDKEIAQRTPKPPRGAKASKGKQSRQHKPKSNNEIVHDEAKAENVKGEEPIQPQVQNQYASTATVAVNSNTHPKPSNTAPATAVSVQKYTPIPKKTRDEVLARDKCCQYRARPGFPQCGSRWQLEPDHIKPRWAGGTNDPANLQALCKNHNLHRYRQQAGIMKR